MTTPNPHPPDWDSVPSEESAGKGETDPDPCASAERTIVLKHLGGAFKEVTVLSALDTGFFYVRWTGSVGSAPYVLHVFRAWGEHGAGWLYKTEGSRTPLSWRAHDLEKTQALWRSMTGRQGKREWQAIWKNGVRTWAEKTEKPERR